jgi:hypothetical protein
VKTSLDFRGVTLKFAQRATSQAGDYEPGTAR